MTIEDPIDYRIECINRIQVNETQGITFREAVETMLRPDPYLPLVGDMRDRPSAEVGSYGFGIAHK